MAGGMLPANSADSLGTLEVTCGVGCSSLQCTARTVEGLAEEGERMNGLACLPSLGLPRLRAESGRILCGP